MFACKVILLIGLSIGSVKTDPFYRRDYTYNGTYDAFYKLHTKQVSYDEAIATCTDEGSQLFYAKTKNEWTIVKQLADFSELSNITHIFVGDHNIFNDGELIIVDGQTPFPNEYGCTLMNINAGFLYTGNCFVSRENEEAPKEYFLCKRNIYEECPTNDIRYRYNENAKKCYKINYTEKTWSLAVQTCYVEGGILAIIENDAEAKAIAEVTRFNTKYFVGFRTRLRWNGIGSTIDYYNLKGKYLRDTGFNWWYSKQNGLFNIDVLGNETYDAENYECETNSNDDLGCDEDATESEGISCGVVVKYSTSGYKASDCNTARPFICQMEVQ
ncbi:uncharacterized protein LOC126975770 [Leptidea sinapis]|uniref:uncharacterized protein LOC126975770 n=1 Tax=Leptidea sinapis TaxID=189913 RepID=UPI0021C3C156|nr:uncharacterized protein LOC126975770 [Leptidea sinapis]